jgi:hypothetical protein
VISVIFVLETSSLSKINLSLFIFLLFALSFNVLTDYVSLFVIRRLLVRSGTRAVIGLSIAAVSGAAIVLLAHVLRVMVLAFGWYGMLQENAGVSVVRWALFVLLATTKSAALLLMYPAVVVFVWLPLFALGILAIRALTPLSWIVEKAQWVLKEGDKHPLKAIGCVAAVAVFVVTVGLRAIIGSDASTDDHKGAVGRTWPAASVAASDREIRTSSVTRESGRHGLAHEPAAAEVTLFGVPAQVTAKDVLQLA